MYMSIVYLLQRHQYDNCFNPVYLPATNQDRLDSKFLEYLHVKNSMPVLCTVSLHPTSHYN